MRRSSNPWGYKIDYDKEIAEDLRCIAIVENQLKLAETFTDKDRDAIARGFIYISSYMAADPERAALAMGLELQHVCDFLAWNDYDVPRMREASPGWATRAAAVERMIRERYDVMFWGRDLKKTLSKYKADLARHQRNKVKFGG